MASTRPHRGPVASTGLVALKHSRRRRQKTGEWRPDVPFNHEDGVKVTMRREHGVTKGDVLRVPFRFQVPPMGTLSRPMQFNWASYDTLRAGQRSRPMGRQLRQIQIDTMFVDQQTADASTGVVVWDGIADPQRMLRELEWIMGDLPGSEPQVFRLVLNQPAVWDHVPIVNMLAVLTSLQPSQRPEEVGTEYLSATFLQYPEDQEVGRRQRPVQHGATTHTLHHGDTLYEIAKKSHFHRPSAWRTIAKANGIKGVSPHSDDELAAWAKRHHKTKLKIPAGKG